jgi:hypothetical protein
MPRLENETTVDRRPPRNYAAHSVRHGVDLVGLRVLKVANAPPI